MFKEALVGSEANPLLDSDTDASTTASQDGEDNMTGNKYKRTNFDDDESGAGTPPGRSYEPGIVFKASASVWHSRSVLEKAMFLLTMLFLLVVIVLAILLSAKRIEVRHVVIHNKTEYCMSPACVNTASRILSSMDQTVDPCRDFYTYACGNWIKTHPIPEGHSRWGTFNTKWKENQLVMKIALETPLNASTSSAERKAKLYYQSCMDEGGVKEKLGAEPLIDIIKKVGGWAINDENFDVKTWNFHSSLEQTHSNYGLGTFFGMFVGMDDKNSSRNIIQIDQSGLGLPSRDYYINKTIDDDKILAAYLDYMVGISGLLGAPIRNITEPLFRDMIDFEARIAEITVPQADRRDEEKLYNKMTVANLQKIAPAFEWKKYLNTMFGLAGIQITEDEEVVVAVPGFMSNMSAIVMDMLATDAGKTTLNVYSMWHVAKSLDSFLSKDFEEVEQVFKKAFSGTSGRDEKWRECVSDVDGTIGFAVGAMFVKSAFHGDSKTTAEEMVKLIKMSFKKNLPNLSWMDAETIRKADEKVDGVVDMIGFPDYILNQTALDERYAGVRIEDNEYFDNNLRTIQFDIIRELKRLRKKPDKKRWSMTPPTINAYYAPTKNMIVFPAGILQMPFYDKDYPKSLNFGGIGVVVGHELSHGFDDQGREYDKNGNLHPWWNKDVIARFKERTKCMKEQYSSYTINGEHINGQQTVGENIADNGGLKAAYSAYQDWRKVHGSEHPLPGINMTDYQLFYLGFAQVWCSIATKETYHLQLVSDAHTPAQYRVIGSLSNSKEFAQHYSCPSGTPMNPVKKCEVW
ncbi:endothelin-converting enzyme homolog isoform X4 [Lineus longissimus]|uniref:endothelin-converting enzyme homolog isoform X4 n=1 Tax=Lineus longissimus TaxID=88925 RepID=UPI00315D670D